MRNGGYRIWSIVIISKNFASVMVAIRFDHLTRYIEYRGNYFRFFKQAG